MKAALVHAEIAPSRIPAAARMVERDLVPGFLGHVGARHGYWMVHRRTGNLLILTLWESAEHMDAAAADSAARHEAVGAELGVEGSATYDALASMLVISVKETYAIPHGDHDRD